MQVGDAAVEDCVAAHARGEERAHFGDGNRRIGNVAPVAHQVKECGGTDGIGFAQQTLVLGGLGHGLDAADADVGILDGRIGGGVERRTCYSAAHQVIADLVFRVGIAFGGDHLVGAHAQLVPHLAVEAGMVGCQDRHFRPSRRFEDRAAVEFGFGRNLQEIFARHGAQRKQCGRHVYYCSFHIGNSQMVRKSG